MTDIKALSVLDGRYGKLTGDLGNIFSEYGLIRHRVFVEIEWLKFILTKLKLDTADASELEKIDSVYNEFSSEGAEKIKAIERTTNHDVKAVEYFIKERLEASGLSRLKEWVHFACTSDDINNISYALMIRKGKSLLVDLLDELLEKIEDRAREYKSVPMMSRTHGQPATPTTVGKEFVNFAWRIRQERNALSGKNVQAKLNGATGNYNAHHFVFPEVDWISSSSKFVSEVLDLEPLLFTTQVNPNSSLSYILHAMIRAAAVIVDFDRDMWGYISLGYFKQRVVKGETGSSTMPHKVNPIDFENSEGNMGLAVSMMEHMAVKLLKSRFQRDLSDSTVLRSLGTVFGYFTIGVKNSIKGIGKIDIDTGMLNRDLDENGSLLAEPFQTAMRVCGEDNPYERLKDLTRGEKIGQDDYDRFIDKLEKVSPDLKKRMKSLKVRDYTGLAENLVDEYFNRK
ncbi:MAG: adenylosuccinate lyase [Thermodesulfobacteriota bacterium]